MLAPGNYGQWKSRIKRYIDTKPNNELIYYCLQNPPYKFKWTEKTIVVAEGSLETTTEGYMENYKNVSQDIRDQLNAKAEAVLIILTGIDNDIYFTVDAYLETNLYWEFGKFTSRDGESLELYYSRFYKIMNELSDDQELEAHYMYMAHLQEVTPDPVEIFRPVFDDEPMHKVQNNNDNYNVFAMENEHPEQPESSNDIYLTEQGDTNITIDLIGYNMTRKPMAVPISTREPKQNVNQSVATSSKKTVATDSTVKKSRNITRKLYEQVTRRDQWSIPTTLSGTVKFGNDQIAPILGYGDLVQGTITIKRVYYVEGLNHNLFSVGQFCDADLEVAFQKSTCYTVIIEWELILSRLRQITVQVLTPVHNDRQRYMNKGQFKSRSTNKEIVSQVARQ
ncbi:hypothetical protein Tco_1104801 [Tanacetum coccineum]